MTGHKPLGQSLSECAGRLGGGSGERDALKKAERPVLCTGRGSILTAKAQDLDGPIARKFDLQK